MRTIDQFLNVLHSDDIMVHISADLKEPVRAMVGVAVLADAHRAVHAIDVPLILLHCGM